jgi:hypothetical protein
LSAAVDDAGVPPVAAGVAGAADGVLAPAMGAGLPAADAPAGAVSAATANAAAVMPIVDTINPDASLLFSRRLIEGSLKCRSAAAA